MKKTYNYIDIKISKYFSKISQISTKDYTDKNTCSDY